MSTKRKPEAWETNAEAPFLTMDSDRGIVALHALGGERFRLTAPGNDEVIVGFDQAQAASDALADWRA